jgi:hypothetical protein
MWPEIVKSLGKFPSAVLTGVDRDGYPFSMRCNPQIDESRRVLHILRADDSRIQPGRANLLCHSHNEQLWDLKSFQVLGRIDETEQSWIFHPERFIPGTGLEGQVGQMKGLFKARQDAAKYLQKHGLARPRINWEEYEKVKKEAGL